jgi:hypothetical protein
LRRLVHDLLANGVPYALDIVWLGAVWQANGFQ